MLYEGDVMGEAIAQMEGRFVVDLNEDDIVGLKRRYKDGCTTLHREMQESVNTKRSPRSGISYTSSS